MSSDQSAATRYWRWVGGWISTAAIKTPLMTCDAAIRATTGIVKYKCFPSTQPLCVNNVPPVISPYSFFVDSPFPKFVGKLRSEFRITSHACVSSSHFAHLSRLNGDQDHLGPLCQTYARLFVEKLRNGHNFILALLVADSVPAQMSPVIDWAG